REKLALLEQRISELEARNNPAAELQSPPAIPPVDKAE
ncbi:TPA: ubiquinone biosynthesis accessory factor UbiK, partial [Escherichia coli]